MTNQGDLVFQSQLPAGQSMGDWYCAGKDTLLIWRRKRSFEEIKMKTSLFL